MKKIHSMALMALLYLCVACTTETLPDDLAETTQTTATQDTPNPFENSDSTSTEATNEDCFSTSLIAGQHYIAGTVSVRIEDENLIITYTSNGDWEIGITHLVVGNCEPGWVPLNGGGNPRIGQFEYTEPFSATPYEVVYVIPLEDLNIENTLCFAAHAEVQGPTGGETAWAEGDEFEGNSWAMYVQTDISDCGEDDDTDDTNNNGPF